LQDFYDRVDGLYKGRTLPTESEVPKDAQTVFTYLKAATKATNDKYARVERAKIISELIRAGIAPETRAMEPTLAPASPPAIAKAVKRQRKK
jgi:hypothetical protein